MTKPLASISDNRLLAALPAKEQSRLVPHLQHVALEPGQILYDLGLISCVFLPTSGVVAKIVRMDDGDGIEAGMGGKRGEAKGDEAKGVRLIY